MYSGLNVVREKQNKITNQYVTVRIFVLYVLLKNVVPITYKFMGFGFFLI